MTAPGLSPVRSPTGSGGACTSQLNKTTPVWVRERDPHIKPPVQSESGSSLSPLRQDNRDWSIVCILGRGPQRPERHRMKRTCLQTLMPPAQGSEQTPALEVLCFSSTLWALLLIALTQCTHLRNGNQCGPDEKNEREKALLFHVHEMSRPGTSVAAEGRSVAA